MKRLITIIILIIIKTYFFSQQEVKEVDENIIAKEMEIDSNGNSWKYKKNLGLTFGQTAIKNWSGGGQSNISALFLGEFIAKYQKNKTIWTNSLIITYGMISNDNKPFFKNEDRFDINSKIGLKFNKTDKLLYGGLLNFRSQFAKGYNDTEKSQLISNLLSPAYVLSALGIEHFPKQYLSIFYAPISMKNTIVLDTILSNKGNFGLNPYQHLRNEIGGLIRLKIEKTFYENISVNASTVFFSNYLKNPQNIDIVFDMMINFRVNKYISTLIVFNTLYDDDIIIQQDKDNDGINEINGPRLQLKESLTIGININL